MGREVRRAKARRMCFDGICMRPISRPPKKNRVGLARFFFWRVRLSLLSLEFGRAPSPATTYQ